MSMLGDWATTTLGKPTSGPLVLPDLPYSYQAFEPLISAAAMKEHHIKHHGRYVDEVNKLLPGGLGGRTLEEVMRGMFEDGDKDSFNMAGQAWNHEIYWQSITPQSTEPIPELQGAMNDMLTEAEQLFGSGWGWLILGEDGSAMGYATSGAGNPIVEYPGSVPLLCVDVWEHAYYTNFMSDRRRFLQEFFVQAANWDFARANLGV